MADQNRQSKLAAAKKKLKEFQQKNTPTSGEAGAKKRRKVKEEGCLDVQSAERRSPGNIKNSPKGLASDLSLTNGAALSLLAGSQVPIDGEKRACPGGTCDKPVHVWPTSNLDCLADPNYAVDSTPKQNSEAGCSETTESDRARSLLSTESLHRPSPQLVDLLSQSSSSYVNGSGAMFPAIQRIQEEGQNFVMDQGFTQEQLQTIKILESEKSELLTTLSRTQQAAQQKTAEVEELSNRLQSTKQKVSELERILTSTSTKQMQLEKNTEELEEERDNLKFEALRQNKESEEAKRQASELAEQLKLEQSQNSALSVDLDDLHKRLETADLAIQQLSRKPSPTDTNQQVLQLLEEKQHLETLAAQLQDTVAQLQAERDQFMARFQEEGRVWKDNTEELLVQVSLLSKERDRSAAQIQELEAQIVDLKGTAALMSQEEKAQTSAENELMSLQEALCNLQQEREALSLQYQAQVGENEGLSLLCQEQERRMAEALRRGEGDVPSDRAALQRAQTQNRELKEHLAELQNSFVQLTNENMELMSGLQSEQHVKKELARRMCLLEEDLNRTKEQLEDRLQELQSTQEQRDQSLAHLQQYVAGYQQLAAERQELHRRLLQQIQLTGRLQHEGTRGQAQLELSHQRLEQAQETLTQLANDNEELRTEVHGLPPPRDKGDGMEKQSLAVRFKQSSITIPEDCNSRDEMEAFLLSSLSQLEGERDEVSRRLEVDLQQVAALSQEHLQHSAHRNTEGVPVEAYEALRAAMEILQARFTALMQEKAELRQRVEELEHRCIQLSGETDTIGEYISLYQDQRAILKQRHIEREQYINMLAKDKEDMKARLAELQDLVLCLVRERDEAHSWRDGSSGSSDLPFTSLGPRPTAQDCVEPNGPHSPEEMDLDSTLGIGPRASVGEVPEALGEQQRSPAGENSTAWQIIELLREIQNPQAQPVPFQGQTPSVPFFYRPDGSNQVKILLM